MHREDFAWLPRPVCRGSVPPGECEDTSIRPTQAEGKGAFAAALVRAILDEGSQKKPSRNTPFARTIQMEQNRGISDGRLDDEGGEAAKSIFAGPLLG